MKQKIEQRSFFAGMVLLACLAVYLGVQAMPVSPALTHDSATFINAAEHLAQTGRFEIDMSFPSIAAPVRQVCAFVPGFPVLLSLLFGLGLDESTAIYGLALVMLAALALLVSILTRYLTGNTWWAILAGGWVLVFPPILNLMTYTLTESFFIPLSVVVLLVGAVYLRKDRPGWGWLALCSFLLAIASFVRPVSFVLLGAIGGMVVLRSWLRRDFKHGIFEGLLVAVSHLPLGIYQLANRYCATGGAGLTFEHVTRGWLLQLLVSQFTPQISLGLGLHAILSVGLVKGILIIPLLAGVGWSGWRYREKVSAAEKDLINWPAGLILAYVGLFFIAIFGAGNSWAKFDFPRMYIPIFPFVIILAVMVLAAIYNRLTNWSVRGAILLGVGLLLLGYVQDSRSLVATIPAGRGIEAPAIRDSAAFPYLQQVLKPEDVIYTTKDPTVWYYLRRPVRRVDNIHTLTCQDFTAPQAGGRYVFVLYQFINYPDDPTSASEISWFKQWSRTCGTVSDAKVLGDAAIYIVNPGG